MDPSWCNHEIDSILGEHGRSLLEIRVNNWAHSRNDGLLVIERLKALNIAILGGDVYLLKDGKIKSTYDGWSCEPYPQESISSFVSRSSTKAIEFVSSYMKEIDNVLFAIVPKTNLINDGTGRYF